MVRWPSLWYLTTALTTCRHRPIEGLVSDRFEPVKTACRSRVTAFDSSSAGQRREASSTLRIGVRSPGSMVTGISFALATGDATRPVGRALACSLHLHAPSLPETGSCPQTTTTRPRARTMR